MSASPILALRKAIVSRLASDAALVAALGGAKIYDEAPRGAEPPYIVFSETQTRDWSTTESVGTEHLLVISVISTQRGAREALELGERVASRLDEAPLELDAHRLIDLRHVSAQTRREQNGRFTRVDLRFRATTERV